MANDGLEGQVTEASNQNGAKPREIVLINRSDKGPPSRWDQWERAARFLSLVAIPVVLGVGGWWIQNALRNDR